MSTKNTIIFWAIFCCILWSSAFAGIKIGLEYSTPLRFAGVRFMIAGLITVPFCSQLKNYFKIVRKSWKFLLFLAFIQTTLHYALFYMGVMRVEGALAAIVIGASPLFVAITSHFYMNNDKMTWPKSITIFAGLAGVSLVAFGRNAGGDQHVQLLGVLFLIITNIAGSFNNILVVKEKDNIPPLIISSFSMFVGGVGIWLFSIPMEGMSDFIIQPRPYYIALAWLSFVSAAGVSIWTMLLKRPGIVVSELNFWKFLIPVSGAILTWIILPNESPNVISIIGMGIIGTSLVLLNLYNQKKILQFSKSKK